MWSYIIWSKKEKKSNCFETNTADYLFRINGRWKTEDGRRKMEDGSWETEVGRRKMEDGRW
ncbi:MAG: hypothetical protein ACI956_001999, partial [Nonlabens sp.]